MLKYIEELESCKAEIDQTLRNELNIASIKHKNILRVGWIGNFDYHYVLISDNCKYRHISRLADSLLNRNLNIMNLHSNLLPKNNFIGKYFSENVLRYFAIQLLAAE